MKKFKKILPNLIVGMIFLIGLGIFTYPTISDQWNKLHQSHAIASYEKQVEKMSETDFKSAWEEAEAYNETITTNTFHGDAFSQEEKNLRNTPYWKVLNLGDNGLMGYISVPKIKQKLPIYHGTSDGVLQIAAGHMSGTKLPIGGAGNHSVLAAHRGLPSAQLFTKLDRLKKGDIFTLHVYDQVLTYEVDQIAIVEPEDYGLLQIEEGQDLCTLFTCTPYGINTHRLLVRGHRIENRAGSDVRVTSDAAKVSSVLVAVCIAIPLLIISFLVADWSASRSKKKNKK